MPAIVAHFDKLEEHQEKPISIGGVGAGRVLITHVLGLWLPWMLGKDDMKLVIGLGDKMLVNLLIGLPFQVAMQCVIDIGNLKCHSNVFNATWKITLKVPHKKDVRGLDAAMSAGKCSAFPAVQDAWVPAVSPSPNKCVCWDWELVDNDEVPPRQ